MSKRKKRNSGEGLPLEEQLAAALRHHQAGRLKEASSGYRDILRKHPRALEAMHLLSLLDYQQGRRGVALIRLAKVVELDPQNTRALNDLGNMKREGGETAEAERLFRRLIALEPDNGSAHNSLGVCLKNGGQLDAAREAYQRAIALQPDDSTFQWNLGQLCKLERRWSEAEECFRRLVELSPHDKEGYRNLGIVLRHQDKLEEARDAFQRLLDLQPDSAVARHLVAACGQQECPERAEAQYVRDVFDEFADTFESELDQLGYDAPAWTGEVVLRYRPDCEGTLAVLDAGCGTGLCGPHLRPLASRLTGVDLSSGMLAQARRKNVYDDLLESDLMDFLGRHQGGYDVIVAADTFNYFGDLADLIAACGRSLRNSGLLIFTLEHEPDESGESYRLFPHGRFGHRESYVLGTLREKGFAVLEKKERQLRMEAGMPVSGLFLVAESFDS